MPLEYRILLVDDDRQFADLLSRQLFENGYHVTELHHPRHGLEAATLRDYDVVVLARRLPEIDGLRLMKILKGRIADLAVVMLSNENDAEDRSDVLDRGAFAYLTKPCRLAEIEATIQRAIEDRCERQSSRSRQSLADMGDARQSLAISATEFTTQNGLR